MNILKGTKRGEVSEADLKEKVSKTQTEKNKQTKPSLDDGIDFGEGISVDDVLRSFGIVIND